MKRLFHDQKLTDIKFFSVRKMSTFAAYSFLATILLSVSTIASSSPEAGWSYFKQNFVDQNGRVIDAGQGNISHSEGQGVAMLLAVHFDDRASFEQIWRWTRSHLLVRGDNLLAWRWAPQEGITDKNNASDGDLLVAWSLLRASNKWHAPGFLQASKKIAHDIREKLLRKTPQGLILLPGVEGFDKPNGIKINLSYWIFPALDEIGQADPSPEWESLSQTGMTILQYANFGRWGLPPDWLILSEKSSPPEGSSGRFGYNAIRIPLYLLWSGRESPALLEPYRKFWGHFAGAKFLPTWTDLKNDSVDSYDASTGVRRLVQWVHENTSAPDTHNYSLEGTEGYYSTSLFLLTEMAIYERDLRRALH